MQRSFLALLLGFGILASLSLFFLSKDKPLPSFPVTEPASRQISLYHYFSGSLSGGLDEMIATVNRRSPDSRVEARALDHEGFKSMIHSTLARGNPPELFSYWAGARVQSLVDENKLTPLDDLWQAHSLDERFPRALQETACTYNGKKYLLPITQHVVVFFYDVTQLAATGAGPPSSWEEFVSLCRRLRAGGIIPLAMGAKERWPAQFWFDYLLLRTAGPLYRQRLMVGTASYADPEVRRVYRMWAELLQAGMFNTDAGSLDWAEATELVCQGKAAMTLMGTWALQALDAPECGFSDKRRYDFFAFPSVDAGVTKTAVGPVDGIVLSTGALNQEFAKTIIAFFAETESQENMSSGSGSLAPSLQVPGNFYSPLKQRLKAEIDGSPAWAFNYDLATSPAVAEQGMDSFAELIAFPGQHQAIVENLAREVASLPSGVPPSRSGSGQ